MNAKIFQKLKQAYSHLGLGDGVLQAHSDALAAIGLVTDENIEAVVAAQKTFLENLQKENDKRATDAAAKARTSAKKEFEDAAAKAAELKAKEEAEKAEREKKEKEMPDWYKAEKAQTEKMMKELLESNKSLSESLNSMKTENEAFKAKEAEAARKNLIVSKAKELGIPQYRIDEGFSIAADADEAAIVEHLTMVSNNTKKQNLPGSKNVFPQADGKVDKAEADAIAKSLIG